MLEKFSRHQMWTQATQKQQMMAHTEADTGLLSETTTRAATAGNSADMSTSRQVL